MTLRLLLFVPADRPDWFGKAVASDADALILDLEDSVASERKAAGRAAVAGRRSLRRPFVRINPLDSEWIDADLAPLCAPRLGRAVRAAA
jgi:citrate lyase subunit beta/citryl-CoA lyase